MLVVKDLVKHYPRAGGWRRGPAPVRALDGVSFVLERGEALGLVGASGSGKSSVARIVVGLERASMGSVQFEGRELTALRSKDWRPLRRRIQMVFQDPGNSLDPRQSALASVMEPFLIHGLFTRAERRTRAIALLEAVGIPAAAAERYPHEFSGGQRQRISIARALALEPALLVLDEPVSALDVAIQAQVLNLLHDLQEKRGLAYLFIAHDLAVVRALCSRIAVMAAGRVVECASREELFSAPMQQATRRLLENAGRL
jgi:ABC-type oligopeptide transport system ATPase subunit